MIPLQLPRRVLFRTSSGSTVNTAMPCRSCAYRVTPDRRRNLKDEIDEHTNATVFIFLDRFGMVYCTPIVYHKSYTLRYKLRRFVGLCKDFRFFVGLCKSFRLKSAGGLEYNICQRQAMHTPAIHKTYHNRAKTARIGSYVPPPPHCLTARVGRVFARVAAVLETTSVQQQDGPRRLLARWAPPCCCTLAVTARQSCCCTRTVTAPISPLKLNQEGT